MRRIIHTDDNIIKTSEQLIIALCTKENQRTRKDGKIELTLALGEWNLIAHILETVSHAQKEAN
jgi:hypothetical protein